MLFPITKEVEQHLIDYIHVYLRDKKKITYATRNIYLAAIFTFYAMNNSTLNKKKIYSYLGEQTRIHRDRPYATEEIRRLLHGIDLLLCSIVLLLSSWGCRRARSYNYYYRHQQTSTHLRIIMSQLYATCNDKGKRDGMSTE
jgi:hypothetical protein